MTGVVLFDLDGTLLPIDFDAFLADYFGRVCRFYRSATGIDFEPVFKEAVEDMLGNDGTVSNADRFRRVVHDRTGRHSRGTAGMSARALQADDFARGY